MDNCGPIRGRIYPMAFHNHHLYTDSDFYMLVGESKSQFLSLVPYISGNMRTSKARSVENALALFLMKLRHNTSQEVINIFLHQNVNPSSNVYQVERKSFV